MAPSKEAKIELTEDQLVQLGVQIGAHMAQHPPMCKAFTGDEIMWFKACHQAALKTKNVALATTVGFLVLGLFGIIGAGMIYRIKELLGK